MDRSRVTAACADLNDFIHSLAVRLEDQKDMDSFKSECRNIALKYGPKVLEASIKLFLMLSGVAL